MSTAAGREFYSPNQRETSPEMADLQYISSISVENRVIATLLVCQGIADRYLWPVGKALLSA
jgi:hypothetical protein